MTTEDYTRVTENNDSERLAIIGARVNYCLEQYQPYLRKDFNLLQLSVITNIPVSDIENYFSQSIQTFNQYLDGWRIKYAKTLMNSGKVRDMEIKTIGILSGFSSAKHFTEAYKQIEGISPEMYQSQINKSKSL